jgi:hypothetical protein
MNYFSRSNINAADVCRSTMLTIQILKLIEIEIYQKTFVYFIQIIIDRIDGVTDRLCFLLIFFGFWHKIDAYVWVRQVLIMNIDQISENGQTSIEICNKCTNDCELIAYLHSKIVTDNDFLLAA